LTNYHILLFCYRLVYNSQNLILMETIFDHNITKKEIKELFRYPYTKEEYLEDFGHSEISCNSHIYLLYVKRNNKPKWVEYLSKIPDSDWKIFELANFDH
ncbi:MAG: hypothetical protein MJZ23_07180, partial [Paludibacteraceae bacterium]|nr:hypothetical protein [Paludibacteraceae bacterium]